MKTYIKVNGVPKTIGIDSKDLKKDAKRAWKKVTDFFQDLSPAELKAKYEVKKAEIITAAINAALNKVSETLEKSAEQAEEKQEVQNG